MWTLIVCIGLILLGLGIKKIEDKKLGWRKMEDTKVAGWFYYIGICFLVVALLAIPISYLTIRGDAIQYQTFQEHIEELRESTFYINRVEVENRVVRWNQRLASWQWKNSKLFLDDFIPDIVDELEPIR